MGMFDYVRCDFVPQGVDYEPFQTKSLDCTLDEYRIDEFRGLIKEPQHEGVKEVVEYTGEVEFYGLVWGESRRYKALFNEGILVGLRRTE